MIGPHHRVKQLPKWAQIYIDSLLLEIDALRYELNQQDTSWPEPPATST
jgi:hypothetical protein